VFRKNFWVVVTSSHLPGGGLKHFLFSSLPREMIQFDYILFFKWVELKPPPSLVFFAFFPDSNPGSVEGFPTQLQLKPNRLRSKGIPPLKDALINEPEDHLKACPRKRHFVFSWVMKTQ